MKNEVMLFYEYRDAQPGPATQLAKGYASLFQKTLRKGLFFSVCMSLILEGKKGSFFWEDVSTLEKKGIFLGIFTEKGSFSGASSQRF